MSTVYPTSLVRKLPYITVSPRGISNGQSSIPNDGADFGPDTLLGATAPNQYGPPYTQTSGIQEAIDYSYNAVPGFQVPVKLVTGSFEIYTGIKINPKVSQFTMYGEGTMPTYVWAYTNDDMFLVNPNWSSTLQVEIDNLQPAPGSGYTPNSFLNMSPPSKMNWIFQSINLDIANSSFNSPLLIQNIFAVYLYNYESYNGYGYRAGLLNNIDYVEIFGGNNGLYPNANYIKAIYLQNCNTVHLSGFSTFVNASGTIQNLVLESGEYAVQATPNSATINSISARGISPSRPGNQNEFLWGQSNTTLTINSLVIDGFNTFNLGANASFIGGTTSNVTIKAIDIRGFVNPTSYTYTLPFSSTTAGPTAGSVLIQPVTLTQNYKKYIITFSGYENNTTTNQTINFPMSFSSYALITGNNTGLTISTTATGITITSPNSTTTYSGIVIVEGY